MPPSLRRRAVLLPVLAALALLAALAAPGSAAAAFRPGAAPPRLETALPALPEFLVGAWRWLAAAWSKEGCGIDPGGVCVKTPAPPPAPSRSDSGCTVDPGALCTKRFVTRPPVPRPDGGCTLYPDGRCL
ncbi:MAG TPA: hypothetical protein VHQ90_00950 [Thermoanaerobaculia bacterium]|nr:hypothetical protein [Thermoanaerobaculia bacterium]